MLIRRMIEHMKNKKLELKRQREQFTERVNAEYERFRIEILSGTKEEVYENAFRIYFYRELVDYLTDEFNLKCMDEELLENAEPIAVLWLYYIKSDWTSIDSEENIFQLTEDFCESERRAA